MEWPSDREGCLRYIAVTEYRNQFNTWRWQRKYAAAELPEPALAPAQEDAVFLGEVFTALAGRPRAKPAALRQFVENCDGVGQGRTALEPLSNTEKCYAHATRKWLRAWAEENT